MTDRSAQAEATRRVILDAAQATFARHGYAGTTMRQLAEAARVSQALLHHHFGTKRLLYDAVKARLLGAVPVGAVVGLDGLDAGGLVFAIESLVAFFGDNPEMLRLTDWDRLESGPVPWEGEAALFQVARAWVAAARDGGLLRPEVDPEVFLLVFGDALCGWVRTRARYRAIFGWGETPVAELDARFVAHLVGVLLAGAATPAFAAELRAALDARRRDGS